MREERAVGEEVIDKGRETATESRGFRLEAEIFLPRRRTFWRMPSMEYGNIFWEVEYRREGLNTTCAAICLFSPFFMDSEATCCPDALSLQCVGVGAPPYCFVLAVCFIRAIHESPLQKQQDLIDACRGDSRIARNIVRSVFRLRTNKRSLTNLGRGGACSRRYVVCTYQEPSPVGEGGSRRLTDEVSVSLFALYIRLQPMFAFIKSLPPRGRGTTKWWKEPA